MESDGALHMSSSGQPEKGPEVRPGKADEVTLGLRLGLFLSARGLSGLASQAEKQALERARDALGEEHPDTLTAMNNLAITLGAQGNLARARELEQRVLEGMRRVLGEDHPDTVKAMNNFAATLREEKTRRR
jgi:hypothetical protein